MRKGVSLIPILLLLVASLTARQSRESASAVPVLPTDIPATADRYSVSIMGNLAGQQVVWIAPDGTVHIFFQFNDRGRGPKTTNILTLNSAGLPVAETVSGNDYLKSIVSESYTLQGGTARWKNDSEQGEKTLTAPAVYLAINSAPAEVALLVHAARETGGKIALLPEGEARIERLLERDVESPSQKKHLVLWSVEGLDFSPVYVWLDDADKFFAATIVWTTVIPDGWEKIALSLQTAQDQVSNARASELAVKLAH